MPVKRNKKSGNRNKVKFPKEAVPTIKKLDRETPARKNIEKDVEELCDSLMSSQWNSWSTRPGDLFGYFVIAKWYPKQRSWALLYVGRGHVSGILSKMFSGHAVSPIGRYVSSFPKSERSLLWMKFCKDSYFERMHIEEVISGLGILYNRGSRPPFNFQDKDFKPASPHVPENFSILD